MPLQGADLRAFLAESRLAHWATVGPDGGPRVRPETPEVWKRDTRKWLERIATRYGESEGKRWLAGAIREPDRVVLRLVPDRVVAWHYGKGDYGRMQKGESLRVELP